MQKTSLAVVSQSAEAYCLESQSKSSIFLACCACFLRGFSFLARVASTRVEVWKTSALLSHRFSIFFSLLLLLLELRATELTSYPCWSARLLVVYLLSFQLFPFRFPHFDQFDRYSLKPTTTLEEEPLVALPSSGRF